MTLISKNEQDALAHCDAQAWRGRRGWTEAVFRSWWPNHRQGHNFKVLGAFEFGCLFTNLSLGRNCRAALWNCSCAQSWRGRVMERDLGEGLILWWNILWISVDYLLFSISHICWPGLTMFIFQVDFSIPGLTCPETSIAFDTDFEWRERGDVEHFGITNRC